MTVQVDLNNPMIEETGNHVFTCFASDVDVFRQGFPRIVTTNLGNGQNFIGYKRRLNAASDTEYVVYKQEFGCICLKVFND